MDVAGVRQRISRHCLACRTHYTYESGREDITTLYLVPVAPGVTRAYNKVVLKNVASRTKSIFNFLSRTVLSSGFFHAFGHGLVDQVVHPPTHPFTGRASVLLLDSISTV